jgi:hypothetical protein
MDVSPDSIVCLLKLFPLDVRVHFQLKVIKDFSLLLLYTIQLLLWTINFLFLLLDENL